MRITVLLIPALFVLSGCVGGAFTGIQTASTAISALSQVAEASSQMEEAKARQAAAMTHGNSAIADVTEESLKSDLIKGTTTESEVRNLYGEPNHIQTNVPYSNRKGRMAEGTSWTYNYMDASSGQSKSVTLYIHFNQNGTIHNYSLTRSQM